MKNELLTIGSFTIYGYGLMIAIGIVAAFVVSEYRVKKNGLDPAPISSMGIWIVIGGMLGAKVLYWITKIRSIIADPKILLDISNGFIVYGGIIGGVLAAYLYCRRKHLDYLGYFDLIIPTVALAQGFGRIGCFLAGCCYGKETTCPVGIVFPESAIAPSGVSLIPTQLISSAFNFLHFFALVLISRTKRAPGQIVGFYLVIYSIGRFIVEFFRGDLAGRTYGPLSGSQIISIGMLLIGVAIVVFMGKRNENKKDEEDKEKDECIE